MQVQTLQIHNNSKELVNIAFTVKNSLALVGQSGSGKSLTLKALLNLLPSNLHVNINIKSSFECIAGKSVAFVPQNPFTALSPLTKIKHQLFIEHTEIKQLFKRLKLDIAFLDAFASELSGGQLQRIVLAMALSSKPKLLLLDEPTTALDPETTKHIIDLIKTLQKEFNFKLIFVTHDIQSAFELCEDIAVIKEGKIIEMGTMKKIYHNAQEDYTQLLINSSFTSREFRK